MLSSIPYSLLLAYSTKQPLIVPVEDTRRSGIVDNNTMARRHLLFNPEAVAPTPPEYLAPWLYFGKPNMTRTTLPSPINNTTVPAAANTVASPSVAEPSILPTPTATPTVSSPAEMLPEATNTPTATAVPVSIDGGGKELSSPNGATSPPVAASAEATVPESPEIQQSSVVEAEDTKAGLPQEKDKPLVVRGFDNSVIRNLNRRLEDPDWQKRAEASNDFSMILGANPNLERRPAYKPYIDAFMLKILRDSSAVVHEPALRSIQVGYYRHPTQAIMTELTVLKTSVGLFGLEPQMVTDALYALYEFQQQEQAEAKQVAQQKLASSQPKTPAVPKVQLINT